MDLGYNSMGAGGAPAKANTSKVNDLQPLFWFFFGTQQFVRHLNRKCTAAQKYFLFSSSNHTYGGIIN